MLQLNQIRKSYTTGDFTQVALDDVSIAFRANEFVAVLGPSGSGKTTMLNIVGGLDQYESGDLVIDGTSTKLYKDRDWDTYRNNRVGFVFQSYNLIPHQTVLANVELALTLAGVSPAERRRKARAALEEVGLGEHVHKRPNQLSGGQMQRVAIARALVNDPEILLADEPTGALDSTTSVQIMALLTEIARDRLVVMVTHNPELAEQYATRTVSLRDGVVVEDTDPYFPEQEVDEEAERPRRTSMSFLTAIALSFNNLMTKKGRTLMTAFAGSIGIIGIAAILALANGVGTYIKNVEEETLSMYPLSIQRQGLNMASMLAAPTMTGDGREPGPGEAREYELLGRMFSSVGTNDLASLKEFFDDGGNGIGTYANAIEYSYAITPQIYLPDTSDRVQRVNPDSTFSALGLAADPESSTTLAGMGTDVFAELASDLTLVKEQYDVVAGDWPSGEDEAIVVLTDWGGISDYVLYAMGLRDRAELDAMVTQMSEGQEVDVPTERLVVSHDELLGVSFKLVHATDFYVEDTEFGVWTDRRGDEAHMRSLVEGGEDIRIVGVLAPKPDATATALQPAIYYTPELTRHIIERADSSRIVQAQLADPDVNVFSGRGFDEVGPSEDLDLSELISIDEEAIADAFTFDESALSLDFSALDFSGMELPQVQLDPSLLPPLDLDGIIAGLDLTDIIQLPAAEPTPEASPEPTPEPTPSEPTTPEDLTAEALQAYEDFVAEQGLDPEDPATNLPLFLASVAQEAADAVEDAGEAAAGDSLVGSLVSDYLEFTTTNGLNPADVEANLPAFLESPAGAELQDQLLGMVDLSSVETQLQGVLGDYMEQVMGIYGAAMAQQLGGALESQIQDAMAGAMDQLSEQMSDAMGIDEDAFAEAFDFDMDPENLTQVLMSMAASESNSYSGNLRRLGWADFADPAQIDIYPIDFEAKAAITAILDDYNAAAEAVGDEDRVISWTDLVGTLMSSVTDIINTISYVLIAFVAISLVVSSIMIGVITYISVLERKKEIGILRSIGASKRDIARVFNAETLIVGFVAGALGIAITALLTIPTNAIVAANFDVENVAILPWQAAIALVFISMALTFLAGLIPSSAASRKDPVEALRSE